MHYVHITAGAVDAGPCPLPAAWRRVSGLDGLSDDELAPLGWYPVQGEAPAIDAATETVAGPVLAIEGEAGAHIVTATWTVTQRPIGTMRERALAAVRAEAARRILEIAPEWRQRNLTARAVELIALHGPAPLVWPQGAQDEWAAGAAIWARIKAVRAASNAAEAAILAAESCAETSAVVAAAPWPE